MRSASSLAATAEQALAVIPLLDLRSGDAVIVTGSTVLPFPVESDDLDLLLITPHREQLSSYAQRRHSERLSEQLANGYVMSYHDLGGRELDLEVWPLERVHRAIDDLGTGVVDIEALEADFTRIGGLEVKVGTDLFHGLLCGVPVVNTGVIAELRAAVDWTAFFSRRRDQHLVNVRDARKGMRASLKAGRSDEAYLKLGWAADNAIDALIFHRGYSLNRWKWRLRYLERLTKEGAIERGIADWYRGVRFPPRPLSVDELSGHIEVLGRLWAIAGTEPAPSPYLG
jgi:hypothetical protein